MADKQEQPVSELVEKTIADTRKLVKKELELAKRDLFEGARDAARSGVFLATSASLALCGVGGLAISVGLALPTSPARGTLFVSLAMLTGAAVCGALGVSALPQSPLRAFKEQLDQDVGAFTDAGV